MRPLTRIFLLSVAVAVGGALVAASSPVAADPPGHAKKGGKHRGGDRDGGGSLSIDISIGEPDRVIIRDYYGGMAQRGHCPPGLAKKHNGCMPPGQAKKWAIGQRLPRDVIFHELPNDLRVRLSVPPQGYRYVRVAADVLMIAVGTGLVAAAIEDIARL
jgi:Ni/Co efflux regulator RcnB